MNTYKKGFTSLILVFLSIILLSLFTPSVTADTGGYVIENSEIKGYQIKDNWVWREDNLSISFDAKENTGSSSTDTFELYVYPEGGSEVLENSKTVSFNANERKTITFDNVLRDQRDNYVVKVKVGGGEKVIDNYRVYWLNINNFSELDSKIHQYMDKGDGDEENIFANYVLQSDIDASSTHSTDNGWWSIGRFWGVLDGQGHKISHLKAHQPVLVNIWEGGSIVSTFEPTGFIGASENGYIKNIVLENVDIWSENVITGGLIGWGATRTIIDNVTVSGKIFGYNKVGGIAGEMSPGKTIAGQDPYDVGGTIKNCIVENAEVHGDNFGQTQEGETVGGIVGNAIGDEIDNDWCFVEKCAVINSHINADYRYIGGVVGTDGDGMFINKCFVDESVTINSGPLAVADSIGGIIGYDDSAGGMELRNSYSRATMGGLNMGGIVGQWPGATINTSDIILKSIYFSGIAENNSAQPSYNHADIGYVEASDNPIRNYFWDNEANPGFVKEAFENTSFAKSTSEMTNVDTFTDTSLTENFSSAWDFVGDPNDDTGGEDIWDREDGKNDNYPYLVWADQRGLYGGVGGGGAAAENSVLNVKYNVPGYAGKVESNIQGPSMDNLIEFTPGRFRGLENLASGSYTVEAPNISGYSFDRWEGDIKSTNRTVSISLSEKTITGIYQKYSSPGPTPTPDHDLSIEVETGIFPEDEFIPQQTFNITDRVFVHVKVYDGGDLINADVSAEWQDRTYEARDIQTGEYIVSFVIPDGTAPGRHVVEVTGDTAHGTVDGTDTFGVDSFLRPPKQEEFPSWFRYLAILLIPLFLYFMPKDEWNRTPQNWSGGSMPTSWTFSDESWLITGAVLLAGIILAFSFGIVPPTIFYALMAVSVSGVFLIELYHPRAFMAAIGFDSDYELNLLAAGLCFGPLFAYLSSVLGEFIVGEIWAYSLLSYLMSAIEVSAAKVSTAVLIPLLEACAFRGVLTPSVSEKFGILPAVASSGILFGLAHVLFGAGVFMMLIATIFGAVTGYITLRNQSLMFAILAHITYNTTILLIVLGII